MKADIKSSACPKLELGRDRVAYDVNALTTHVQEAARKLRRPPAMNHFSPGRLQVFGEL